MIRGERWIGADPAAVADEAARRFVAAAGAAIAARGRFVVALAGGSTPKAMYQRLAKPPLRDQVDWQRVDVWFGDERAVPPDHPDSNYGMAARALLDHVPIDRMHVHRMEGERPPAEAARAYESMLKSELDEMPQFDLILLGMGPDGHTASLFPHTAALAEKSRLVSENRVDKLDTTRLTFTAPLINAARAVVIAACGAEKQPVLRALASEAEDPALHPILLVQPRGALAWLLDRAAAP